MEVGSSQNNKIFIITKGKFARGCENVIRENVTLLDGKALADYLIHFGLITAKDFNEEQRWDDLRHD